jgi:hypothetical protein
MNLMYIVNFKVFGYYLPFWRKMQTKLKVRGENMPELTHRLGHGKILFDLTCPACISSPGTL